MGCHNLAKEVAEIIKKRGASCPKLSKEVNLYQKRGWSLKSFSLLCSCIVSCLLDITFTSADFVFVFFLFLTIACSI